MWPVGLNRAAGGRGCVPPRVGCGFAASDVAVESIDSWAGVENLRVGVRTVVGCHHGVPCGRLHVVDRVGLERGVDSAADWPERA